MRNIDWEVIEQDLVGSYIVKIWLIARSVKPSVAHIKDGQIELTELKEGEEIKPTFEMNYDAWKALKKTMVDKQEREKSTVEAELTATKYHLEDMRKLVFKDEKSEEGAH